MKWWGLNYSLTISLFIAGCIGIDPEAEKAKQELLKLQAQSAAASTATTAASTTNTTTPTTAAAAPTQANTNATSSTTSATNPEDIKSYYFDSAHQSMLRTHFLDYVNTFKTITDKNAEMTKQKLDDEIQNLPSWTAPHTNWKTKEGHSIEGAPPENSNIAIKPHGATTELRTDGTHVVHNFALEEGCGLYIAEKSSLSAESVSLAKDTWLEMRGKAAFSELHMGQNSILDISQGKGLTLASVKKPEDLQEGTTKAVGEAPNTKGQLTFREGHKTHIDNAYLTTQQIVHEGGNLHVSKARINLQDDKDGSGGTDATYIFRGGKIIPIEKTDATEASKKYDDVALQLYGRFFADSAAQLQIHLFNGNKTATKYEFYMLPAKKEHRETVQKRPIDNNDRFQIGGIIIVPSSGGIPTTGNKPIKLITSNIGLGSFNRMEVNNRLAAASRHIAGKNLRIVSYSNTNEGGAPPVPHVEGNISNVAQDSQGNYLDENSLYLEVTEATALFSASIVGTEAFNTFANDWEKSSVSLTQNTFILMNSLQHSIAQENKTYGQKFGLQHSIDLPHNTKIGIEFSYAEFNIDNPVVRYMPKELSHFFGMNQSLTFTRKINDLHFSVGAQNTSVTDNAHDKIPYSVQTMLAVTLQKEKTLYAKTKQQIKIGTKAYIHSLGRAIFNGRVCNRWFASVNLKDGPASFSFDVANLETDYYKLSLSVGISL